MNYRDHKSCAAVSVALAALLLSSRGAARDKTDVLVLENGDHLTGEIKGMSRGKLDFRTDDAGALSIEWVKIARATSPYSYELELGSGDKYFGKLLPPPAEAKGVLLLESGKSLPIRDVVSVVAIDSGFRSRLKAYLDVGFTLAKANRATTLTAAGEVAYRGERVGTTLGFNTYVQDDQNSNAITRAAGLLSVDYYLARWRASLLFGAEKNDELDLKLRLITGAGAAYPFVRSKSMELWGALGLLLTREDYAASEPSLNLEGYLNGTWEAFRYDSPKMDLGISASVFPGLTDFGRVRGELSARLKYELFADFNVGLTVSSTFDSKPPDPAAAKTDYVATFTVGWSYHR